MNIVRLFLSLLLVLLFRTLPAQQYPVQVVTEITPPYSLYLSDYTTAGTSKLALNLLLTDISRFGYAVKLRLIIEGDGITISTSATYMPPQIMLDGGSPLRLTGDELSEYFNPNHLDFKGYSREKYLNTGALPEGIYRIGFQVLDYNKSIAVSAAGASTAWMVLNDPPLLNMPDKDAKLTATEPQNILFQWTPRHLGSPNSAFTTEYVFQLYEIWPTGRNANEVVNATQPLVEQTLSTTIWQYTNLTEASLIPGRQYAYRVQARNADGFDLFRNKGYSEVQQFTYGDPCDLPTNITAQASSSSRITITWNEAAYNTAFTIQYRKANVAGAEWFTKTSYTGSVTIDNLEPSTTYEYQVQSQCGTINTDYSETQTVTTQAKKATKVVCGAVDSSFASLSTVPLTSLLPGDILSSGNFEVQVTQATGSAGVYSGEGFAHIPFMGVKVHVTFTNIHINEKFQVTQGRIVSVYNPNSNFILQTGNTTATDSTSAETDTTIQSPATLPTEVTLTSDIDTIYKTNDSTVLVVTADGEITTVITGADGNITAINAEGDTIAISTDQPITIADNNGTSATIDNNGNITYQTSSLDAVSMYFAETEQQTGGFDAYNSKYAALDNDKYYQSQTINSKKYYIPWVSVSSGTTNLVTARISKNKKGSVVSTSVTNPDGITQPLVSTSSDSIKQLTLNGTSTGTDLTETYTGYYAATDTSQKKFEAGKLNVVTYPQLETNVVIVPVNSNTLPVSLNELTESLNATYKQACVKINVTQGSSVSYSYTNFDAVPDSNVRYSSDMYNLIQVLNAQGVDESKYYLFVLDKSSRIDLAGIMPFGQPYGFVFAKDPSDFKRTVAHELGHGAYGLLHTFNTYGIWAQLNQGQTDNLMDYADGSRLFKFQWDIVHHPVCYTQVCAKDDESEGAMGILPNTALVRRIIEKLRYCYVNSQRYSLTEEESGNNYCSNIKLSDGNTYSSVSVNNNHEQWSIMPNTCLVNNSNTIINYVPRDEAGIPFSVKAGDFTVRIDDSKNASFVSYMKPDATKWQNQITALKTEIFNEADRDKSVELMYALPDELFTTINADHRKKYLKRLSEGSLDEGMLNRINEEKLVIQLISTTQSDQIESIVNYLKSDRLMSDFCNGIDNIGGEDNFTSFTNALFKLYLQKYSSSLTASYILPDDRVFQWMDKGLLDKITYKIDYLSNNQIAFSWKYRQDYYTNPVKVSPFEIVAVNFTTDVNFITIPNDKRVVFMPAFVFAWMVNEDNNVDTKLKADITIKLAEFVFAYYQVKTITKATSTLVKTLRYINTARTGTNLILVSDAVRDEIENLTGGPSFIAAYEKINDVWEISDFTVNWFNGNIEHFTVFTQAWDKLVDSNRGIDVVKKYPEFYKLVNQIKEGLK